MKIKNLNKELATMRTMPIGWLAAGCRMAPAYEWQHLLKHAPKRVDQLDHDDFEEFRAVVAGLYVYAKRRGWAASAERIEKLLCIVRLEAFARAKTKREKKRVRGAHASSLRTALAMARMHEVWAAAMTAAKRRRLKWEDVVMFGAPENESEELKPLPAVALRRAMKGIAYAA